MTLLARRTRFELFVCLDAFEACLIMSACLPASSTVGAAIGRKLRAQNCGNATLKPIDPKERKEVNFEHLCDSRESREAKTKRSISMHIIIWACTALRARALVLVAAVVVVLQAIGDERGKRAVREVIIHARS